MADFLRQCGSFVSHQADAFSLDSTDKGNLTALCHAFCGTLIASEQDFTFEDPLAGIVFAALAAPTCHPACMDSAAANREKEGFGIDFCKRLVGQGHTEDWCDANTGNGPGGFVTFRPHDNDASREVSVPCDGQTHAIPFEGDSIRWACSGGGEWQVTRKNPRNKDEETPGWFQLALVQGNKSPLGQPACRLLWDFD